jgi:Domain of unknown function (DUF5753)
MSKVVRIETGTVGVSTTDLRALLGLYGLADEEKTHTLIDMARVARRRPWYARYDHARDAGFTAFLGYEGTASEVREFQPLTIPGVLQTEDYATAIIEANLASHAEERRELRLKRQKMLLRQDGPFLRYVLDESALRRQVGGRVVMLDQLGSLADAAGRPRVSVQVIPLTAGAHASMTESFMILHSDEWNEDVLFRETALQTVTDRDAHEVVANYLMRFDLLRDVALDEEQTLVLIDTLIEDMQRAEQAERSD